MLGVGWVLGRPNVRAEPRAPGARGLQVAWVRVRRPQGVGRQEGDTRARAPGPPAALGTSWGRAAVRGPWAGLQGGCSSRTRSGRGGATMGSPTAPACSGDARGRFGTAEPSGRGPGGFGLAGAARAVGAQGSAVGNQGWERDPRKAPRPDGAELPLVRDPVDSVVSLRVSLPVLGENFGSQFSGMTFLDGDC